MENPIDEEYRVTVTERIERTGILTIGWARSLEHYAYLRYGPIAYQRAIKRCLYHLKYHDHFDMERLEELVIGDDEEPEEKEEEPELEEVEDGVGLLQCFRCKSTRVESYQRQTRSADEAMTVFCMCLECHHKWKQ